MASLLPPTNDNVNGEFLVGDTDNYKKPHLITWKALYLPIQNGGLGLNRMDLNNSPGCKTILENDN